MWMWGNWRTFPQVSSLSLFQAKSPPLPRPGSLPQASGGRSQQHQPSPSGLREVSQLLFLSAAHDIPTPSLRDAATGSTASWQNHASQLQPQGRHGPYKTRREQDRDREGVGAGGALAPGTSSPFLPEPPGASGSNIPVYCALLASVVLGLLAYVAFKCWCSRKQRQQLAKARTAELGAFNRDQMHGDSSVFQDSPSSLEPCVPSQGEPLSPNCSPSDLPSSAPPQSLPNPHVSLMSPIPGPHPELGCRLYLHLPRQQQEEVEQLLEASGEPDKGWRGLAGHLGYQAEAVETMAQSQVPAYTLLRYWAVQEGSGATLRVLADALAVLGREDVVRALGPLAGDCSVV
ncbi:death domain-containing membrane protein NRADD-like isoform X1 [Balaenoptera musculus]|uniref:Death domain-containing membrane protein NRADD-like isoform X1 n=1 Tax=Balaenoptera musculus TaxID=9771 RepID=A0A8B8YX40_BALMU|nr:death domain-containing membrane protein NRADD-like isoform X1 [Balaenoptera musculus]